MRIGYLVVCGLLLAGATVTALAADASAPAAEQSPWGEMDTWARPLKSTLPRTRQAPTESFAGKVLVDVWAGDDNWNKVAEGLDKLLASAGLTGRYLEDKALSSPLVAALESGPRLAVIGSTRRFTSAESVAVAQYAAQGGRVLFVAYASGSYSVRLVDANQLMGQFGFIASQGRGEGTVLVRIGGVADGLSGFPNLGGGVGLWTVGADPVAAVERVPVAVVVGDEGLRVGAVDGRLLLSAKGGEPAAGGLPGLPFTGLVRATLNWLLAE
jgi:hypothetical protein